MRCKILIIHPFNVNNIYGYNRTIFRFKWWSRFSVSLTYFTYGLSSQPEGYFLGTFTIYSIPDIVPSSLCKYREDSPSLPCPYWLLEECSHGNWLAATILRAWRMRPWGKDIKFWVILPGKSSVRLQWQNHGWASLKNINLKSINLKNINLKNVNLKNIIEIC